MRKLLALGLLLTVFAASPAFACKCSPDDSGAQAQAILSDSSYSLANVYVRGLNTSNGQSMLELKNTIWGGLMAQNFRAKFATHSCGVVPQNKTTQTLLIHFEKNGTYSIANDCETRAVQEFLKKNPTYNQGQ